jgi:hypothetical protein
MGTYGKFAPQPERYGGGRSSLLAIFNALNKARGTGYDTSTVNPVTIENFAYARAIWEVWETNRRMSVQCDPFSMSDPILARWERIFHLARDPKDTPVERRARVQAKFALFGFEPKPQAIADLLAAKLGSVFVAARHISPADSVTSWEGGTLVPGYPWYSTVGHVAIQLQKPTGYTEQDFYKAAATVFNILDPIMPAQLRWAWYRNHPGHTGSAWSEDDGAGFILDTPNNLDNQVFGT